MIEIPEAMVLSEQINEIIAGKQIRNVTASLSPHKFAWFCGNPEDYNNLLKTKSIIKSQAVAGYVEIMAEDVILLFGEGIALRFFDKNEKMPDKHQLLLEFEDDTYLLASVQMYGGLWCFKNDEFDNKYYKTAKEKPSPLSEKFDLEYFNSIISTIGTDKLSAKAVLATEQRIPGLGNGTLQDILFNAGIHPKKKASSFTEQDNKNLFNSIKNTLHEMYALGGRDTEKNLFGNTGSYKTKMSKNTAGKSCSACGQLLHIIQGENARNIYWAIIENNWVSELSHAAYLGKELTLAELSIISGNKYVQDKA